MKVSYKFILNAEKVTPVIFTAIEEYTTQKGVVLVKDLDGTIFNKEYIDIFYDVEVSENHSEVLLIKKSEEWIEFSYEDKRLLEKGDKVKLKNEDILTLRSGADIHPFYKNWHVWVEDFSINSINVLDIEYYQKG